MKLKVTGVIMDLDGTLVDSRQAYREALRRAFAAFGFSDFDAKLVFEIPRRLEQGMSINDLLPFRDVEKFLSLYLDTYYALTEELSKPMSGVDETLKKLCGKVKLALLTMRHTSRNNVKRELEKFRLAKYFRCIVTALDTSSPKPSPEPILACAQLLGVNINDCAVVGDSISDVRAGKAAGARTIALLSGIFTRNELEREKPDLVIENINALPDFIL
ncbi:MAG: HAD family hydrolase [Candidatus Bathyarchaeota archaeon]|nr:HAD family hydrolase [Candidatus Bathyarchaeota archaeon]